jgi:hypothetical protein
MPEHESLPESVDKVNRWWKLWKKFCKFLFCSDSPAAMAWTWTWAAALILCALCSFLSNMSLRWFFTEGKPWTEFVPSCLICELSLILLCAIRPLPVKLSFVRMGIFPIFGVWLPYGIRFFCGGSPFDTFAEHLKKEHGINLDSLVLEQPGASSPAWLCLGCSIVVAATALLFNIRRPDGR